MKFVMRHYTTLKRQDTSLSRVAQHSINTDYFFFLFRPIALYNTANKYLKKRTISMIGMIGVGFECPSNDR